jgi:hypothetical protein
MNMNSTVMRLFGFLHSSGEAREPSKTSEKVPLTCGNINNPEICRILEWN